MSGKLSSGSFFECTSANISEQAKPNTCPLAISLFLLGYYFRINENCDRSSIIEHSSIIKTIA